MPSRPAAGKQAERQADKQADIQADRQHRLLGASARGPSRRIRRNRSVKQMLHDYICISIKSTFHRQCIVSDRSSSSSIKTGLSSSFRSRSLFFARSIQQ